MPAAMSVNDQLASFSNTLVYSAMAVYLLAFLAYCAEWAFGSRSAVARQSASLAPANAPVVQRAAAIAASGSLAAETATGTATLARPQVVLQGAALPPTDGPGPAGGNARADRLGRIAVSLTVLAAALHLAAVVLRGLSVQRPPWGNLYEFTVALTLVAALLFVGLLVAGKPVRWLGLPLVTGILLGLGIAVSVLYTAADQLVPALHSYWLWIHVSAATVCGGALYAGFFTTLLYLGKDRHERRPGAPDGRPAAFWDRLPAAATLDKLAYRINAVVFPLWTFAIIAGAIWAEAAWGHYWQWDPTETWAFITWVGYAAYLHARATAGWKGRKAACLSLIAFGCYLFNSFGVSIFINGLHSYAGL